MQLISSLSLFRCCQGFAQESWAPRALRPSFRSPKLFGINIPDLMELQSISCPGSFFLAETSYQGHWVHIHKETSYEEKRKHPLITILGVTTGHSFVVTGSVDSKSTVIKKHLLKQHPGAAFSKLKESPLQWLVSVVLLTSLIGISDTVSTVQFIFFTLHYFAT